MFSTSDTIVAVATPPGRGGIGVVRISGPSAPRVASAIVERQAPLEPRHATFTRIVDSASEQSTPIDQVVLTWFAAPRSYTGEDVVEISAHGSPVLLHRVVELAMAAGARLAEPGEFTLRGYLNGRLDLVQAEAVADLVAAVTPLQARAAMDQLEGTLTKAIARIDTTLFDLSARLEASLDFPDEGFHFITRDQAAEELRTIARDVAALGATGRTGRVVREGRTVVIVGRPNAGKSSLFNALVGAARAIVTEIPGTTRDVLTERVDINGLAVTLVDTAGLRESGDAIEVEGVERARQARQVAALSLLVLDRGAALTAEDLALVTADGGSKLIVASKSDLPNKWSLADVGVAPEAFIEVSALAGEGLDDLRARIARVLCDCDDLRDTPRVTNIRHLSLLDTAHVAIQRAVGALAEGATEELVLADLGAARRALEEITGRRSTDDLLHHIFASFCVGK